MAGNAAGAAKAAATRKARQDRGGDDSQLIEPAAPQAGDDGPGPQRIGDDGTAQPIAKKARASFPADAAGDIAIEELTPAARERIARAARALGPSAAPGAGDDAIDPAIVGLLYDALGSFAVSVCVGMGYTDDSAKQMQFNEEDKARLIPITGKVLSKYSTSIMTKWQDEIGLAITLYSVVVAKSDKLQKRPKPTAVVDFPATPEVQ